MYKYLRRGWGKKKARWRLIAALGQSLFITGKCDRHSRWATANELQNSLPATNIRAHLLGMYRQLHIPKWHSKAVPLHKGIHEHNDKYCTDVTDHTPESTASQSRLRRLDMPERTWRQKDERWGNCNIYAPDPCDVNDLAMPFWGCLKQCWSSVDKYALTQLGKAPLANARSPVQASVHEQTSFKRVKTFLQSCVTCRKGQ